MSIQPLQLAFYKGVGGKWGALQFNVQRPHYFLSSDTKLKNFNGRFIPDAWKEKNPSLNVDDLQLREGCLFLEISTAIGPNQYDWSNKTVIALSVTDMGKILQLLEGFSDKINIMHDPGAKTTSQGKITKSLDISSPKGLSNGCMIQVSERKAGGEDPKVHKVPLSGDEVAILRTCIRHAIPRALAW